MFKVHFYVLIKDSITPLDVTADGGDTIEVTIAIGGDAIEDSIAVEGDSIFNVPITDIIVFV